MAAKVKLNAKAVQAIVARARRGQAQGAIADEMNLKGHVVREVLRSKQLVKVTPERLERARAVVAVWTGKAAKVTVADPGRKPKAKQKKGPKKATAGRTRKVGVKGSTKRTRKARAA